MWAEPRGPVPRTLSQLENTDVIFIRTFHIYVSLKRAVRRHALPGPRDAETLTSRVGGGGGVLLHGTRNVPHATRGKDDIPTRLRFGGKLLLCLNLQLIQHKFESVPD